jgi:prevent-host-death family protein
MERRVVGVRELKTRLGRYLRSVREGRTVLVTDRGEPIAELRPLAPDRRLSATLVRLSVEGAVTLPGRRAMSAFAPIRSRGRSLSDAVIDEREDRA